MLVSWGSLESDAKRIVKSLFDETKKESKIRYGKNIYVADAGDGFIKDDNFMAPRRKHGVTDEDVRRC